MELRSRMSRIYFLNPRREKNSGDPAPRVRERAASRGSGPTGRQCTGSRSRTAAGGCDACTRDYRPRAGSRPRLRCRRTCLPPGSRSDRDAVSAFLPQHDGRGRRGRLPPLRPRHGQRLPPPRPDGRAGGHRGCLRAPDPLLISARRPGGSRRPTWRLRHVPPQPPRSATARRRSAGRVTAGMETPHRRAEDDPDGRTIPDRRVRPQRAEGPWPGHPVRPVRHVVRTDRAGPREDAP